MPELPEVETVVRAMAAVLPGRRIDAVKVLHKPSVSGSPVRVEQLVGRRITSVYRRAKFIRFAFEDEWSAAIHLRMTGWLGVLPAGQRDPKHEPYVRVRFMLDGGRDELVFRDIRTFGRIWCGPETKIGAMRELTKLGPEPLEIASDDFIARLRDRSGGLKALLLNQEFLAGLGNIYADEALHASGLHPLYPANKVRPERARVLLEEIRKILNASILAGGSSVVDFVRPDGERGWFQRELRAYGREGQPCLTCGAAIQRIVVGQRGTWFCPRCQKVKGR